jgi:hypothetical protein
MLGVLAAVLYFPARTLVALDDACDDLILYRAPKKPDWLAPIGGDCAFHFSTGVVLSAATWVRELCPMGQSGIHASGYRRRSLRREVTLQVWRPCRKYQNYRKLLV